MQELFALMRQQHGVATTSQARALGLTRRAELRMLSAGSLQSPARDVLAAGGVPVTFEGRAMAAALSPGVTAVSHGAAARLHGLDGFERHETVDVIGVQGANPRPAPGAAVHYTRGPVLEHTLTIRKIPTMSIASTLALLAPAAGIGPTARALDSALRLGVCADELRMVALAWRSRGRSGPPALLMLLGERVDSRLPHSWFQRVAARVAARVGIRMVDGYPVRDRRGILLAELDLADPVRRVGVETQNWEWHASAAAQSRDGRRKKMLRQIGWEIVDVWWSDLRHPERVIGEVVHRLRARDR
jgi:very-short-patch-repair endonuclease